MVLFVSLDEEQVVGGRGLDRRFDGREPGTGDGAGRQSRARIRVVRMIDQQVGAPQELAMPADGVLHGRVGLQRHPDAQTVPEHG